MTRGTILESTLPLFVPAVVVSFFLGGVVEAPTEDLSSILAVLATVQGAIFAIVFSVLILAVQLSASQYSLRLPNLLVQTDAYRGTVVVFAISLGWTLIGMYLLPLADDVLSRSIAYSAGLFAIIAGYTLYLFIGDTIAATTPEGVISVVSKNFSSGSFLQDAERSEKETLQLAPFMLLSSITSSLINEADGSGAKEGVAALGDNARETVEHHGSDIDDVDAAKEELEDLLTEGFPEFLEDIESENLRPTYSEVIHQLSRVGNASVNQQYVSGVEAALTGTTEGLYTRGNSPIADDIREKSAEAFADILTYATSNQMYAPLTVGLQRFGARAGRLMLQFESNGTRGTSGMNLYMGTLPRIQNQLIEHMSTGCLDITDWPPQTLQSSSSPLPRGAIQLWLAYVSTAEISSAILRNHESAVDLLVDPDFVAHSWFKMVNSAAETGLTRLYLQWLGTAYYIDYIDEELGRPMEGAIDNQIFHTDVAHRHCALLMLKNNEMDVESYIDIVPGRFFPHDPTGQSGAVSRIIQDPTNSFDEYLDLELQTLV